MSPGNIGIVFAPTLFRRKVSRDEISLLSDQIDIQTIIELMIIHYDQILVKHKEPNVTLKASLKSAKNSLKFKESLHSAKKKITASLEEEKRSVNPLSLQEPPRPLEVPQPKPISRFSFQLLFFFFFAC